MPELDYLNTYVGGLRVYVGRYGDRTGVMLWLRNESLCHTVFGRFVYDLAHGRVFGDQYEPYDASLFRPFFEMIDFAIETQNLFVQPFLDCILEFNERAFLSQEFASDGSKAAAHYAAGLMKGLQFAAQVATVYLTKELKKVEVKPILRMKPRKRKA